MIGSVDLDFINHRADAVISSRSAQGLPSVCWGMGCHARAQDSLVTVWLARSQGAELAADVRNSGRVAVAFSNPLTSRSIQLKGRDAIVRDANADDVEILKKHLINMVREVEQVGFSEKLTRNTFEWPWQQLLAIEFTPDDMFEQTPGPLAGKALASAP